jgi:hypothetical protein
MNQIINVYYLFKIYLDLKDIYLAFKSRMTDIEKYRSKQLETLNNLIIPATVYYPEKAKTFKSHLTKINDIKKNKEKDTIKLVKANTKNDLEKSGKLKADISKYTEDENTHGRKMESDIIQFEAERVDDNKYLLLHYIHSEIAFHATALENLTKLYSEINVHDPKEKLPVYNI